MMDLQTKYYLGILAIFLSFSIVPYIISILRNKTKPHAFSWLIWGISTLTIYFAQALSGAGAGSWSIGVSGVITIGVAILAYYKKSDDSITKTDWICLIFALLAIPFWYITSSALYAVLILTAIDLAGYWPTLRKSYHKPFEENITLFSIMTVRNLVSILALETYSVTNILFQSATMVANFIVIALVLLRRSSMK